MLSREYSFNNFTISSVNKLLCLIFLLHCMQGTQRSSLALSRTDCFACGKIREIENQPYPLTHSKVSLGPFYMMP